MDWTLWLEKIGASGVEHGSGLRFSDYNLAVQAAIVPVRGRCLEVNRCLLILFRRGFWYVPCPKVLRTDVGYDVVTTRSAIERAEVEAFIGWDRN